MTNGSDPAATPAPSHDPAGRAGADALYLDWLQEHYTVFREDGRDELRYRMEWIRDSGNNAVTRGPSIRACVAALMAWAD